MPQYNLMNIDVKVYKQQSMLLQLQPLVNIGYSKFDVQNFID